ncbi:hypothetical protein JZ751_026648 [Albula glossodonta]|uniref:Uncharacterized protein n=1 Tax=Albula glossodonta TaxID=121402 RepID=A0A8T2PCM2_9TELE|nr:hypothetical protein JZ751_026648 [Albula glossodonta]
MLHPSYTNSPPWPLSVSSRNSSVRKAKGQENIGLTQTLTLITTKEIEESDAQNRLGAEHPRSWLHSAAGQAPS